MEKRDKAKYRLKKIFDYFLRTIFLVIIVAFGTFVILYSENDPKSKNTFVLSTTKQPESYTELYFENHEKLPNKITPNKQYTFSFTINNLENRDITYPYEVYLNLGEIKLFLDKGSVFIKKNGHKTIRETFTFENSISRINVVVDIVNKNQQIDFWIEGI